MEKTQIIKKLKQVEEFFSKEYIKKVIFECDGYVPVDSSIELERFDIIAKLCSLDTRSKTENKPLFNKINLSFFDDLLEEVKLLKSDEKLEIYNEIGKKHLIPMFILNNRDVDFCIEVLRKYDLVSFFDVQALVELLSLKEIDEQLKIRILNNNEFNFEPKELLRIIQSLEKDENKLTYLKKFNEQFDSYEIYEIIKTIKEDNIKIETLRELNLNLSETNKIDIINLIKDDEKKLSCLKEFSSQLNPFNIGCIVVKMKNDNIKIEALKESSLSIFTYKEAIIKSLEDDENKLFCIREFAMQIATHNLLTIIDTFKNDLKKIEAIIDPCFEFKISELVYLITSLKEDENRFECLKSISNRLYNYDIITVIKSFKIDDKKIIALKEFENTLNSEEKIEIIKSFAKEENKIKYLIDHCHEIELYDVFEVVKTFKNDKVKIEALDNFDFRTKDKTRIILSLEKDENKISCLRKFCNQLKCHNTFRIIKYISEDENKLSCLREFGHLIQTNKTFYFIEIIKTISDPNKVITATLDLINDNDMEGLQQIVQSLMNLDRDDANIIYDGVCPKLSNYICEKYNMNPENYKIITDKYGFSIIKYLKSDAVRQFINGGIENIDKINYLMSGPTLDMNDVNNIAHCLIQRKFNLENPNVRTIFTKLTDAIESMDELKLFINTLKIKQCNGILNIINEELFLEKINKYGYKLDNTIESFSNFLDGLCFNIIFEKNEGKKKELKTILHEVTNYYIKISREQYAKEQLEHVDEILQLRKVPIKDKQIKLIFQNIESSEIKSIIMGIDKTKLSDEKVKTLVSEEGSKIIDACISFLKNPDKLKKQEDDINVFGHLKSFNKLITICYEEGLFKGLCEEPDIMRFEVEQSRKTSIYELLSILDYSVVTSKLLPFDDKVDELKKSLDKCKIFDWGTTFDELLLEADFESKKNLQSALINCGYKKIEGKDGTEATISDIISFANAHSYTSLVYKNLFEKENCLFIISDSGVFSSSESKEVRLAASLDYYKKMYEREAITVPPIREEYKLGADKKLRVVLGDVVNPINLTLGERLDSCMRIGGAGRELFDFCALNESGFHIRFEDVETGNFISRVSGFRNGNTVFLNQLRWPADDKYSDDELIEVLRNAAKKLIDDSKDSAFPIDNVVVSDDEVMHEKGEKVPFGVDNIQEGFERFYWDDRDFGIVLASSKNDELVPIQLSNDLPRHQPLRLTPKINLDNEEAIESINHIKIVEKMLTGESFESVELVSKVKIAITGEDWYSYVDNKGILHSRVINGISEQRKIIAEEEMKKCSAPLIKLATFEQKADNKGVK